MTRYLITVFKFLGRNDTSNNIRYGTLYGEDQSIRGVTIRVDEEHRTR